MASTLLECEHACLEQPKEKPVVRRVRLQWASWLWTMVEVRRQRRTLLSLDDRMLADIGLSRADAWHEGGRALHDLPDQHLRRIRR